MARRHRPLKQTFMSNIRAGIIGCGGIARFHQQAYQKNGVTVVAYADPNTEAAQRLSAGQGAVFSTASELLKSGEVDVVSICTPPAFHEEPATLALDQKIHVLCEKPLAHNLEASRRMAVKAQESEAILMCAFRHRFINAIQTIKSLLPQIGPVVIFQNTFCGPNFEMGKKWFSNVEISGGGCLPDTTAHSVDLFRFLVGEIRSSRVSKVTHLPELSVEDAAVLIVESHQGVLGSLVSTWVSGTGVAFVDIIGQNGRIVFDYFSPEAVRLKLRNESDWSLHPVTASNGFAEQTAHFLRAVRGEEPLTCSAHDGLRAFEVIAEAA